MAKGDTFSVSVTNLSAESSSGLFMPAPETIEDEIFMGDYVASRAPLIEVPRIAKVLGVIGLVAISAASAYLAYRNGSFPTQLSNP